MSFWLAILVTMSAYQNLDSGLLMEVKSGASFLDQEDEPALLSGARISYAFSNPTDAFISLELDGTYERVLRDPKKNRFIGGLNIGIYEIYFPFAFRLVAGGLVERRDADFSPGFSYRFGLGYYFNDSYGLYLDYGNRIISRELETTYTNEASLALQIIF